MFAVDNVAASNEFDNLPDGFYKVVIIEAKVKEDDKGARFEFTYVVEEGQYAKRRIWGFHLFKGVATTKPKTLETNLSLLKDLFWIAGFNGFKTLEEAQELASNFIGIELYVKLKTNTWQGKTYQNPTDYYKADGTIRPTQPPRQKLDVSKIPAPTASAAKSSADLDSDVPF